VKDAHEDECLLVELIRKLTAEVRRMTAEVRRMVERNRQQLGDLDKRGRRKSNEPERKPPSGESPG